MLVIQSESEIEDFALEGFINRHESAYAPTPTMFCFDHKANFELLVANLNKETEAGKQAAQARAEQERAQAEVEAKSAKEKRAKEKPAKA